MRDFGPFCSHCGGDRGPREPADPDGLGCLDNIYHFEVADDGYPTEQTFREDQQLDRACRARPHLKDDDDSDDTTT